MTSPIGRAWQKLDLMRRQGASQTLQWQLGKFGLSAYALRSSARVATDDGSVPIVPRLVTDRVVLSPHFDDAALSTFSVLDYNARVITVFAGQPDPHVDQTVTDELSGFANGHELVAARDAEDAQALGELGVHRETWPILELAYRTANPSYYRRLSWRMSTLVRLLIAQGGATVYVPAGAGGHPNHLETRDAFLLAWKQHDHASDVQVTLYAEHPYWAGKVDEDDFETGKLTRELEPVRRNYALRPYLVEMTWDQTQDKLRTARRYETQFPTLGAYFGERLVAPEYLGVEHFWDVQPLRT